MRINEVDPRNYDSDIDYYNALNAKPKARVPSEPRLSPAQQDAEDEDAISQKRQAAHAQFQKGRKVEYVDDEGTAPNGQKYNKLYVIHAKDEVTAQHEEYLFDKHEWGAKKIIDVKREKNEDGTVTHTMYIVDNHKYGLWRPWKDSPVYKEGTEQGVAEGLSFNDKRGKWEWDDGTRVSPDELTPAQKQRVEKWKAANPGKRPSRASVPDTREPARGFGGRVFDEGVAEGWDPDTTRLEQDVRDALENGDDYTAKQYAKMAPTPEAKKYLLNIIKQAMYIDDLGGETDWKGVAEMDSQGYRGSRDDYKPGQGKEGTGKPLTAKQMMDRAHKAMMKSMSDTEKVDKGWRNPNKDVAEAEEDAFMSKLGGLKTWQVVIMNNYYRGKYSDYSGRYYYVLASSPEEAKQVVLDNADAILQELLAMKSHNGKKILPRSSAVRITADRIGKIEDGTVAGRMSTSNYKKMFSPQGVMMVKLSNGAIADVQGQEQNMDEGMLNNAGQEESPVAQAITRRILMQRTDLLGKYGPAKVGQAIDDVAEWVGDVDEIGSSDVSGWVRQVEQSLNSMGESVTEADNPKDVICVDVPLFIRLLEYAREDASTDMDLHDVAERLIKLSAGGETVTMSSYDSIVGAQKEIKEAGMEQVEQGRKNIISILKAAEQGQDAEIIVGGEPITLEYPEARYVGGRYKAFMKADRQGEFLRAITDPVAFDRIMAKMRATLDKQKNFRGSVPGERGVEEGVVDTIKSGAKKAFKALTGPDDEELIQRLEKETGGKRPEKKDMPPVKENEYYCRLDKVVKEIPEGYVRTADGYITRK